MARGVSLARRTGGLGLLLVLWALPAFVIEPDAGRAGEFAIDIVCLALLIVTGRALPREERFRVGAVVLM